MFSSLNYIIFKLLYEETSFYDYINKFGVRKRNILFRVYVLLGPISFATTFIFVFFFSIYLLGKYVYMWVIDVDNEQLT